MPEEIKKTSKDPIQFPINTTVSVQSIYANGTAVAMSQTDIQITFALNGRPDITAVLALPTAKTLLIGIERAIKDYERKTDSTVRDSMQIAEMLKKS